MKSAKQAFLDEGWSEYLASEISDRITEPRFSAFRRLLKKLTGEIVTVPRKPSKPKQHISAGIRKAVFERDAYRCKFCGDWHDLSVDHIIPESLGGTLDLNNLQTLCIPCNCRKNNRYVG